MAWHKRSQRSAKAREYVSLYKHPSWQRLRLAHLYAEPTCRMCAAEGRLTAATIVDHIVPHRGDWQLFFGGKLQSLCKSHHDSKKQSLERRGYDSEIGTDGWPIDPQHPFLK